MTRSAIHYFVVDAFTDRFFAGNPAVVVPLQEWRDNQWLQSVAMEFNLPETAFMVPNDHGFDLRWFTPNTEVDNRILRIFETERKALDNTAIRADRTKRTTSDSSLSAAPPANRARHEVVGFVAVEAIGEGLGENRSSRLAGGNVAGGRGAEPNCESLALPSPCPLPARGKRAGSPPTSRIAAAGPCSPRSPASSALASAHRSSPGPCRRR